MKYFFKVKVPTKVSIHKELLFCSIGLLLFIIMYKLFDFHFAFNHDVLRMTYTRNAVIQEQLLAGRFPFWNPYEALGTPLMFGETPLDFIALPLLYILPVKDQIVITGFIYLVAGMYFMYKFLIREGIPPVLSLTGAVVWSFNGFLLWHLHELYFHGVFIFLPLLLLLIKNIHNRILPFRSWLLLIFLNMLQIGTGRFDAVEYSTLIVFLYIMVTIENNHGTIASSLVTKTNLIIIYSTCIILAFALLAPFTFNYLEIILNTWRNIELPTIYSSLRDFVSTFLPNFSIYGSMYYSPMILLPFVGFALFRIRRVGLFAFILIVLYLILSYPTGLWEIVRRLPGHSGHITVHRTVIFFHLGISLLAAYGLREYIYQHERIYDRILLIFAFLLLTMLIAVSLRKLYFNRLPGLIYAHHFGAILISLLTVTVLAVTRKKLPKNVLMLCLPIFIMGYTVFFATLFNRNDTSDGNLKTWESDFFNSLESGFVAEIKKRNKAESMNYRVVFRQGFHPSFHTANFLESINFYSALPSHLFSLISSKVIGVTKSRNSLNNLPRTNIFYSLGSIKYIVSKKRNFHKEDGKHLKVIYSDGDVVVEENPIVFERIRFLSKFKKIESLENAVDFIANSPIDWFKTNFIAHKPIDISSNSVDDEPVYRIVSRSADRLKVEVDSKTETIMVLSNAYNKGWNVKVDGNKAILYRINVYFQGVRIFPGIHQYELYYLPPNLLLYTLVSFTSLILICGLGYICHRKRTNRELSVCDCFSSNP